MSDGPADRPSPLANGGPECPNTEAAEASALGPLAAKTHVSRIMGKPGARDGARLVILAHESGLIVSSTV